MWSGRKQKQKRKRATLQVVVPESQASHSLIEQYEQAS